MQETKKKKKRKKKKETGEFETTRVSPGLMNNLQLNRRTFYLQRGKLKEVGTRAGETNAIGRR